MGQDDEIKWLTALLSQAGDTQERMSLGIMAAYPRGGDHDA